MQLYNTSKYIDPNALYKCNTFKDLYLEMIVNIILYVCNLIVCILKRAHQGVFRASRQRQKRFCAAG